MAQTYKYFNIVILLFVLSKWSTIGAHEIEITERLSEKIPSDIWLLNEHGERINLLENITIPTIISFVYFNCPGICNGLLEETQVLIESSDLLLGVDYQVFTISIDHSETHEQAYLAKNEYVENMVKHKEAQDHWHYLSGDSSNIALVSSGLGVGFKPVEKGFIHKLCTVILDEEGKIVRYNMGARLLPMELNLTLEEAAKGNVLPKIYKKDEYCFPEVAPAFGRLNTITVSVAYVTIALASLLFAYLTLKSRMLRNKYKSNTLHNEPRIQEQL